MTNEGDLSLITWTVITVLPDKITVTLHAPLLTLLAIQIGYLCGLYRCEMEQMANVIDCCTFDLFGDFFFMFYLIYEIKMDLLAEAAMKQISSL